MKCHQRVVRKRIEKRIFRRPRTRLQILLDNRVVEKKIRLGHWAQSTLRPHGKGRDPDEMSQVFHSLYCRRMREEMILRPDLVRAAFSQTLTIPLASRPYAIFGPLKLMPFP